MKPMQLNEYPQAIAKLQGHILNLDQQIRTLNESAAVFLAVIDREIAFDLNLKNDSQRKAKRMELMETKADYIEASLALKYAQDKRARLEIDLQLVHNQFSLLKLDRRRSPALS
jgi:hypothetical protein